MIRQLFFCLTISLAAYGQKNTTKTTETKVNESKTLEESLETFSITNVSSEDFFKAKKIYKDKIIEDTINIIKKNGIIELPLHRPHYPPSVFFTDTLVENGEEEYREYHYIGHYPNLNLYLVAGSFWEHYECYLVNKETGKITVVWTDPKISPSSEYLANLSMSYGLEGIPNGVQIWKFDKTEKELSKILELDQQIWAPDDFVWETENTLILKVVSVGKFWKSNGNVNNNDYYYLRLKLK